MIKRPTPKELEKQKIVIYKAIDEKVSVTTKLLDDTLWFSLDQIAKLFEIDKSVISRHLKNIFDTKESQQDSVVANLATTASDSKIYNVDY